MINRSTLTSALLLLVNIALTSVFAQTGATTRYVYDNNGQLRAVIAPNGEASVYEYDPAGNFIAIRRLTASDFEVVEFTPRQGAIGTQVTIYGVGFMQQVSNVSFNGLTAQINSQTDTSITTTVPDGATTGLISVTTPRGTRTTSTDFIVKIVNITPKQPTVLSERTLQFSVTVSGLVEPRVIWSVNSFIGGNSNVGTIDPNGLYTAPDLQNGPTSQFLVRATSLSEPLLFGQTLVTIPGQGAGNEFFARAVSVRHGVQQNVASTYVATKTVSVQLGVPANNPLTNVISKLVSAHYGTPSKNHFTYVSGSSVTVRHGTSTNTSMTYLVSNLVSARHGDPQNITPTSIFSRLSVSLGPVITSVSPTTFVRGTNAIITINGINLTGIIKLLLINENGMIENNIQISNLLVNSSGSVVTATLSTNPTTQFGRRSISIISPSGKTSLTSTESNTIEIVP